MGHQKKSPARKEGQDEHPCREREAAADSWHCSDVGARVTEADCSSHREDSCCVLQGCQGAQPQGMNPHRALVCSAPAQGSDRLTVLSLQLQPLWCCM